MNQPTTYTFAENLVQAIVNSLGSQPAAQTRGLLNMIESECAQQDKARDQAARDAEREQQRQAIEQELKAKLQAAVDDKVQTPAPGLPPIDA